MEKQPIFYEQQYFRRWWVIALVLASCVPAFVGLVVQVFFGITFGSKPMSNEGLIALSVVMFIFCIVFFRCNMQTKIDESGVYVKFWPFHRTYRFFAWKDIIKYEIKVYSPMADYGGWGLRGGAYNVAGNVGLLLTFSRYTTLMIGTQKPDELAKALETLNKPKQEN